MTSSPDKEGGPVLDEATFQKLLAAAYVVQEHQDRMEGNSSAAPADSDSTTTLAEIVETQHQIHSSHLDLAGAMSLVIERIRKITGAQGAAIGILDQDKISYRAASGSLASQVGAALRPEATLSAATLVHNAILRCPDAATDFLVNPEITRRLGIGSLIAVPVFHEGKTAGSLELVFSKPNAFRESDVRTCQLMAGLVTEALTHAAEEEWRKGVAAERASMLEVLEKIKPQLARLTQDPNAATHPESAEPAEDFSQASSCVHCGHVLAPGEVFCGACGSWRGATPRQDLQSKWATLWNLKKIGAQLAASSADELPAADSAVKPVESAEPQKSDADSFILPEKPPALKPAPLAFGPPATAEPESTLAPAKDKPAPPAEVEPEPVPVVEKKPESRVWFRSIAVSPPAVQFKGFLEKHRGLLRRHPGDLALVAAGILFVITIIWAISSNHPTTSAADGANPQGSATPASANAANAPAKAKRKQAPPAPQLSLFDQFLVSVGLAEPPPAPTYMGNPNIPVWIDVHTAQYYCPGSDQYGKTPQGRIASQHDAQMDQFEPASRKVCD